MLPFFYDGHLQDEMKSLDLQINYINVLLIIYIKWLD